VYVEFHLKWNFKVAIVSSLSILLILIFENNVFKKVSKKFNYCILMIVAIDILSKKIKYEKITARTIFSYLIFNIYILQNFHLFNLEFENHY